MIGIVCAIPIYLIPGDNIIDMMLDGKPQAYTGRV